MGHRLVAEAYAFIHAHNERARADDTIRPLDPLAVALLGYMAHCASDHETQPMFFAGRDATCAALGLASVSASWRRLARAASALVEAGAVTRARKAYRGSTTVYRLNREGAPLVSPIVENRATPESPNTEKRVTPQTEWVTPDDRMGDTSGTPDKETGIDREGDARANDFELTEPPAPTPWDLNLPEPQTAQEAARCADHPQGTSGRCWACGDNRRAWAEAHPDAPARRRRPLRYDCAAGRHRVIGEKAPGIPDDICATCHKPGVVDAYATDPIGAIA